MTEQLYKETIFKYKRYQYYYLILGLNDAQMDIYLFITALT